MNRFKRIENSLDLSIILKNLEEHLDKKIQDNLVDNTIVKLKKFSTENYNIGLEIGDKSFSVIKDGKETLIEFNEFESMNINVIKSE